VVDNAEVLYRRIKYDWVSRDDAGSLRLSSQAFADKGLKPSVNRAALAPDPATTKFEETDGIAQLVTEEVRGIDTVLRNPQAPPAQHVPYRIDVIERPIAPGNPEGLPENLAHAQIESDPVLENRTRFDKVKDALARLAERRPLIVEPTVPT
jgi:hypothetical protein